MHKLGDGDLLFVGTFLTPENKILNLDVPLVKETLPVSINFEDGEREDKSPATWKTVEGRFYVTFHGLKEVAGKTRILQVPVRIGSVDDRPLSMMFSICKHHKAVQVTVQFMAGGECL